MTRGTARRALGRSATALLALTACRDTPRAAANAEMRDTAAAAAATTRTPAITCVGEGTASVCTVTGLLGTPPAAALTFTTSGSRPDTLRVAMVRAGEPPRPLPVFYGSSVWWWCGLMTDGQGNERVDRLAAADVDADGREDFVVIGECETGVGGPAVTFPVGGVYLRDADGGFRTEERVDSALTDLAQPCDTGACDLPTLAREAVRRTRGEMKRRTD